jgi:hypothetical protein
MKYLGLFLIAFNCFHIGCAFRVEKYPKSHIMTKNNKERKSNLKYQREHAKAAKNKREQLELLQSSKDLPEKKPRK